MAGQVPQKVTDAVNAVADALAVSNVADQAIVDAQAALATAQSTASTADQATLTAESALTAAIQEWFSNPTEV